MREDVIAQSANKRKIPLPGFHVIALLFVYPNHQTHPSERTKIRLHAVAGLNFQRRHAGSSRHHLAGFQTYAKK